MQTPWMARDRVRRPHPLGAAEARRQLPSSESFLHLQVKFCFTKTDSCVLIRIRATADPVSDSSTTLTSRHAGESPAAGIFPCRRDHPSARSAAAEGMSQ